MNIISKINFLGLALFAFASLNAQTSQDLPKGVRENFSENIDYQISDEFNDSTLDNSKWARRASGGYMVQNFVEDKSLVKMESDGDNKYVSIKGTTKNGKICTAGIVSRSTGYYGFYVARFRFIGLNTKKVAKDKSIWHPSIWAANTSHTSENKSAAKDGTWLEIDFVEWNTNTNSWDSDAPARFIDSKGIKRKVITQGTGAEKAIMKGAVPRDDSTWGVFGLEYTPEHLKLWEWKNGEWVHIGDRVVQFIDDTPSCPEKSYTISTIGKSARKPIFWVIGNVVSRYLYQKIESGESKYSSEDMSADFDYFRYYPLKSFTNAHWIWRGGSK